MVIPQNVGGMFLVGARRVPGSRTCFRLRAGEAWRDVSWEESERATRQIALGLLADGFTPGDTLALLADGSPAAAHAGLAALALRGTCAALWPDTPPALLPELVRHTEARFVVLRSQWQADAVVAEAERYPGVRRFLVPDPRFSSPSERFRLLETVREAGRASALDAELTRELTQGALDDPALLVVKRSSALPPRLVRLSHANLLAATEGAVGALPLADGDVVLNARPLADAAAWTAGLLAPVHARVPIAFASGGDLLSDLAGAAPTVLLAGADDVARIAAALREAAVARGGERALAKTLELVERVRPPGRDGERAPAAQRLRLALAERRLLRPLAARLGGRLRRIVSCGDPLSPGAAAVLAAVGVEVIDAYSLAEAAGIAARSEPAAGRPSPLARPVGRMEVAVSARGRLRLRGAAIAAGAAGQTPDGWFEPGDRVASAATGPVLLGRDEETARVGGERVSTRPAALLLGEHKIVRRALVFSGAGAGGGLAAVCELDLDEAKAWATAAGLVTLPLRDAIRRREDQDRFHALGAAVNARLREPERLTALWLADRRWSAEGGELTPAGAIDRKAVLARLPEYAAVPLGDPGPAVPA